MFRVVQNTHFAFLLWFELDAMVSMKGLFVIVNVEEDVVGDIGVTEDFAPTHLLVMLAPVALADDCGHSLYRPW